MSETKGRCRKQIEESYADNRNCVPRYAWITADAIDRLTEDVASIKAKVDAVSPEDVAHLVESEKAFAELFAEQRDAAVRERDQWREEARLAVVNRDDARAEVERLKAIVHSDAGHMAKILIENERLRAAPAAPQPAGQGISPKVADTQPTGNAAPAPVWLTDEEREVLSALKDMADSHLGSPRVSLVVKALLALAGSPPVVEVPEMRQPGPMTIREKQIHVAYRAAMDKARVKWKEVGRE